MGTGIRVLRVFLGGGERRVMVMVEMEGAVLGQQQEEEDGEIPGEEGGMKKISMLMCSRNLVSRSGDRGIWIVRRRIRRLLRRVMGIQSRLWKSRPRPPGLLRQDAGSRCRDRSRSRSQCRGQSPCLGRSQDPSRRGVDVQVRLLTRLELIDLLACLLVSLFVLLAAKGGRGMILLMLMSM